MSLTFMSLVIFTITISLTFSVGSILPVAISNMLKQNRFVYGLFNILIEIILYKEKRIKILIINTKKSINI